MDPILFLVVLALATKYAGTDAVYALKGKPNPRYEAAKARHAAREARVQARASRPRSKRSQGAARRYASVLWDHSWESALDRHNRRREARADRPADAPRGAARVFWSGLTSDIRRKFRRQWEQAWVRADERRRSATTKAAPGQQTVQGEVIFDSTDEDSFGREDNFPGRGQDSPAQDTPAEDSTTPDLTSPADPTDLTDSADLPGAADLSGATDTETPGQVTDPATAPTQGSNPEGNTTMTNTSTEITGLDSAIRNAAASALNASSAATGIESTVAALEAGGTSGPAITALRVAQDNFTAASAALKTAEVELRKQTVVRDAYSATSNQAGSKEFVTAE